MIFANGDCYITYISEVALDDDKQNQLKDIFRGYESKFLTEINTAKHDITFTYLPIEIMVDHDTIEPSEIAIAEVRGFLSEVGVGS